MSKAESGMNNIAHTFGAANEGYGALGKVRL
jgi:hypothetical protein